MNIVNIRRLLHTLFPFMIMVMIQRSLILLFAQTGMNPETAQLCAFLPAVLSAVLAFRVKTYTVHEEDGSTETGPLVKKTVLLSILQTFLACGVMIVMMYIIASFVSASAERTDVTFLKAVSALLIHPVLEEYVFRKLFYGELRLMNPIFGCIAQALMFAIMHDSIDGMIYALGCGAVLAVLYEQSGCLAAVIAAHVVINLRSLVCLTVLAEHRRIIQGVDMVLITLSAAALILYTLFGSRRPAEDEEQEENHD